MVRISNSLMQMLMCSQPPSGVQVAAVTSPVTTLSVGRPLEQLGACLDALLTDLHS